ncbi:MAG: hypothetical protein MAG451_01205 [Anaerolineales bacterium]|nr:hypothetical protein [Anaerolineales bacterium]
MKVMRNGDYLFCEYCSSFHFPEESDDGVRVLGEPTALTCPICRAPLVSASLEEQPALHCDKCRGVLMNQWAFAKAVEQLRARASGPPNPPRPLNREACQRRTLCPMCNQSMDTHPYAGPGNVVIDVCVDCAVIWLDYGEFRAVIDAPGRDRGTQQARGKQP